MPFQVLDQPYNPSFCRLSGTYRINIGPKFYIGGTKSLGARNSDHTLKLRAGEHPNRKLQAAFDEFETYEFVVLTSIPERAWDRGHDHRERIKFQEQLLLDAHFEDPDCCNGSSSSRHNSTISAVLKERWADPEFRALSVDRIRRGVAARGPASAETRAKMSESKLGWRAPRGRACEITLPGNLPAVFPNAAEAARALGVTQQLLQNWLVGSAPWPGMGTTKLKSSAHLVGLRGRYLTEDETAVHTGQPTPSLVVPDSIPTPPRATKAVSKPNSYHPRPKPRKAPKLSATPKPKAYSKVRWEQEPLAIVALLLPGESEERVFMSIHEAAAHLKLRYAELYGWLEGKSPWPTEGETYRRYIPWIGLTGRIINWRN